ncbi:MAG TPA: MipA/OmpV family protein [Thioploca sp.]|nr:MipA/OmpV family protein [Thioploca sp.]
MKIISQLAATLLAVTFTTLQAEERSPLWEAGVGLAGIHFPDYRGARHQQNYLLPMPYFIYRGDKFKINRGGLQGLLYQSARVNLDISLGGAMPVKSDDNVVRRGMPNLDPMFEIGPSLKILLAQARTEKLSLRLPLRAAFATDLTHIHHAGWLFHPQLGLETVIGATRRWKFGVAVGPLYASQNYHDYYYGVAPQYATLTRPSYTGKHGYSGTRLGLSLRWQFQSLQFGAFLRYDNLSGTAFEDSPLLETEHSLMAGFGIVWVFARSKHRVSVTDE